MSTGSLFDEEPKSGSNKKIFIIGFVAFIAISGAAYAAYHFSKPVGPDPNLILAEAIRDNTVAMLAQPTFSGDEFHRQVMGNGRLARYAWRDRQAYFTYPESGETEFEGFLDKYFLDKSKLEFAKTFDGVSRLGDYKLTVSPMATRFFRSPLENVKLETDKNLSFQFKDVEYSASLDELRNLTNNSQLYGGKLIAKMPERRDKPTIVFANHGIMVARPDEPSLKRLTERLLNGVPDNREARIQRLLDFVSNEIEYSYTEAVGSSETLKRASETLMTRTGDCSNKTILLASLLEQIGEEYILLYCPRHITVAIPQGGFPDENKLDFTWSQKQWMIAESTLPGFQIGLTRINDVNKLTTVNYVQDPKLSEVIFDASSFEVLKFF